MADDRRNVLAGDSFPLTINPAANAMGFAGAQPILRAAICPTGKSANLLSSPLCKNISVFTHPKSHLELFASRPTQRGVSRSSRTRDGMRWTRQRFARE